MKEKQKIIVLVPLVILIWGYAIYALIGVSGGDKVETSSKFLIEMPDDLKLSADSFVLVLNYKDPFLKGINYRSSFVSQNEIKQQASSITKPIKKIASSIVWPKLIYKGTIKNKNSNKLIAVLEINGNEALLKEGEEYQSVTLLAVLNDSIYLAFEKEKKYVLK